MDVFSASSTHVALGFVGQVSDIGDGLAAGAPRTEHPLRPP
jgi:hypothetical protein